MGVYIFLSIAGPTSLHPSIALCTFSLLSKNKCVLLVLCKSRPLAGFFLVNMSHLFLIEAWRSFRLPVCVTISQVLSCLCSSFSGPDSWGSLSSQVKDKKKKRATSLTLASDPSSWFCHSSSGLRPLGGVRVCVQVRGFGLSWRLKDSFPVQTGSPRSDLSLSRSHSFIRSFSLGPDSDQRLLEERADIYCSGTEQEHYRGPNNQKM